MKTFLTLHYLRHYNLYHIGIIYVTVMIIHITTGVISNIAECEPLDLKPYVQDPTFIPPDNIEKDGLLKGVYASGYVERPPTVTNIPNFVKPMIRPVESVPPVTTIPSWSIEDKMKILGGYIMSWFSPESWYEWYNKDAILAQQADQAKRAIETTSPTIPTSQSVSLEETSSEEEVSASGSNSSSEEEVSASGSNSSSEEEVSASGSNSSSEEEVSASGSNSSNEEEVLQESSGSTNEEPSMSKELTDYFNKTVDELEKIDSSSLSNTIPSKEIIDKINALLPRIDINTDNYYDMQKNIPGKYDLIFDGIGNYGIENKLILVKHVMVLYNLNAFIYTSLKDTGSIPTEDQYNNLYTFLLNKYTQEYGF